MGNNISFYFTYENEQERDNVINTLAEIFGKEIRGTLRDGSSEKIAHIKLKECNDQHLSNLLREFDKDELRVLLVADELIIGTARCLDYII